MNKRVYISLPITGFQLEERRAYAKKVAENIREKSLDKEKIKTITPFDINEDLSLPYSQLMGKDIAALLECWKSHTNLTHPGKYFRPSKVKIMRPTSPK